MAAPNGTAGYDNTVTVMIGSLYNMPDLLDPAVADPLIQSGSIGLDAMDYTISQLTYGGTGDVPKFASLWAGTGSGTQEGTEILGTVQTAVSLTNTTGASIIVPAQGAIFSTASGQTFQSVADAFLGGWSKGAATSGLGGYTIAPGQTVTIPVEAMQFGDSENVGPNAITTSSIAGLSVTASAAGEVSAQDGDDISSPSQNNQGGFFSTNYGDYTTVFNSQGLAPAEAHVNIQETHAWTANDLAAWEGYVDNARSVGILNVAPIMSDNDDTADLTQPFATSTWYTEVRAAALYGGGLSFDLPPFYWLLRSWDDYRQNIIEQIRWCNANGLRSSVLIGSQEPTGGGFDTQYYSETMTLLNALKSAGAMPSQIVVENYDGPPGGSYYDANPSDINSMNAIALAVAKFGTGAPTPSEDGLEVKGTSKAQTTLIMTGVRPTLDYTQGGTFNPYSITQIHGVDPSKVLTLTVQDKSGLLSLSDPVTEASGTAGGALTFSGTAAQATVFLDSLVATAGANASGTAELQLQLTDYLGEQTAAITAVSLGHLHPQFTSITEMPSNSGSLRPGATVTYAVATTEPVTVTGTPSLLLSNLRVAAYAGMDSNGDLLFTYTVAAGDDTPYLRARALQMNGATITDSGRLPVDPDQFDYASGYTNSFVVDTKNLIASGYSEVASASGVVGTRGSIDFLLSASSPLTSMAGGLPTLTLSDGGTATYSGLSANGQMSFVYQVPTGGTANALVISSLNMNGATATDAAGEPLIPYGVPPLVGNAVSYDATAPLVPPDTVTFDLSENAPGGAAVALLYVDGTQIGGPVTVTASQALGQTQDVTVTGNFGDGGVQNAGVAFENAVSGGNLYLDGLSFDGESQTQSATLTNGTGMAVPIVSAPLDLLQIQVSEDAAAGNALFSVAVDGTTLPGVFTTSASHASGQWQTIDIDYALGRGPHQVTVTFLNQYWGERHLYVGQVSVDGESTNINQELMGTGWQAIANVPAASDQLVLDVSEDAWQGNAQFYVTVDGEQVGGVQTATASHAAGAQQAITLDGDLGVGIHTVGITFINDAWGGTPQTDRNLYLTGASFDGANIAVTHALPNDGTFGFQIDYSPPAFSSITEQATSSGTLRPGASVTYALGLSQSVKVSGSPALLLSNGRLAQYTGQDTAGDLIFRYIVQNGDDTPQLQISALQLNNASIVDAAGYAINAAQLHSASGYSTSFVVDTKNLILSSYSEVPSASGVVGAGGSIDFLVSANAPLTSVSGGTPTLSLSDGGTATYTGLTASGQMSFIYAFATGGKASNLTATDISMNGATATDAAGEPVIPFGAPPLTGSAVSYNATGPLTPADQVIFALSEDAAGGDAIALLYVNGQQVGGPVTVTASHASGQVQNLTVTGNFGSGGLQNASVVFENAASGRNLYLNGLTFDGQTQEQNAVLTSDTTVTVPIVSAPLDLLQIQVSEDAAAGDALFSVAVDGTTLPGTFTTTASHAAGQWQNIDIYGAFGQGAHTVTATFLNQYFGQRHLYVGQVSVDGETTSVNQELMGTGWQATASVPAAPDQLVLDVAESAVQGDAQFYVTVDGKQVGGLQTVTASQSAGQTNAITLGGNFGAGTHTVGMTFINAASNGQNQRELFLDGASYDGSKLAVQNLFNADGTFSFSAIGKTAGSSALSSTFVEHAHAASAATAAVTLARSLQTTGSNGPLIHAHS